MSAVLSAILFLALVGVIVYFLFFHKGEVVLRKSAMFTQASEDIVLKIGTFTKTLRTKKSGDTFTFTTLDDVAYNFNLTPPPSSYEIMTMSENEYYIKGGDDLYLRHESGVFSLVSYKEMFKDNTSLSKSMFTIFPVYNYMIMGPAKKSRAGGVMETVTGDLEKCKAECFSNINCIGFNMNGTTTCDLKTLNFEVMKAPKTSLGPYVDDTVNQYWYKSNTFGNTSTITGTLGHMAAPAEPWNTGQTFQSCFDELMSPNRSISKKFGMGYDSNGGKCYFSDLNELSQIPNPVAITQSITAVSICSDPMKDITKGCK